MSHLTCEDCAKRRKDGTGDHCPAWYAEHAADVMNYDHNQQWGRFLNRKKAPTPRVRELSEGLAKLIQNCPPQIPLKWWYQRFMTRAERVRFDRLSFALGCETRPVSTKVRQRELERYGGVDALDDPEFVQRNLQMGLRFLSQRIEDCGAEGVPKDDPYLVELHKRRKTLRRELRKRIFTRTTAELKTRVKNGVT